MLYALTGNVDFSWSNKCDIDFLGLKKLVSTVPVLRGPKWEFPFHISMDVSDVAIGAILDQEDDKKPYVLCYISKNLTPT